MDTQEKYRKLQAVMNEYSGFVYSSARHILSFISVSGKSIVDFGCGRGDWLRAARDMGASEVLGLDTYALQDGRLDIPARQVDLTRPVRLERRYDIALCLEVGEHLERQYAEDLVRSLVRAAPVVVFSAAAPGQGGVGHVNEQPPEYWHKLFKSHGYSCHDFRGLIWNNKEIEPWYKMGVLVYCAPGYAKNRLESCTVEAPLHLVHPQIFEIYATPGVDVILHYDKSGDRWYSETLKS